MSDIDRLFEQPNVQALDHRSLWQEKRAQNDWFYQAFSSLLETNWQEPNQRRHVEPIFIPVSARYLTSLHLLAPISHRPVDAKLTTHDFQRQFCKSFLDFTFPSHRSDEEDQTNDSEFESSSSQNSGQFLYWMVNGMLDSSNGPDGEFLDYHTPGSLNYYLLERAKNDSFIKKKKLSAQVQLLPFYISVFYTIQKRDLWAQLRDVLDDNALGHLRFPFRLIELFLNRWSEESDRLINIDRDDVFTAYKVAKKETFPITGHKIPKLKVLTSLRLATEEDRPNTDQNTRSVFQIGRKAHLASEQALSKWSAELEAQNSFDPGEVD